MIKSLTALGAAALAAFAFTAPAAAQSGETSVVVSYAGLDLSNPADAARFDMRLRAAAGEVCGTADARNLSLSAQIDGCRKEAIARAKADVQIAMRSGGSRVVAIRTN